VFFTSCICSFYILFLFLFLLTYLYLDSHLVLDLDYLYKTLHLEKKMKYLIGVIGNYYYFLFVFCLSNLLNSTKCISIVIYIRRKMNSRVGLCGCCRDDR